MAEIANGTSGAPSPFPLHLSGMLCLLDGLPSRGGIGGVSGRGERGAHKFLRLNESKKNSLHSLSLS
jgi:hypothetical protein